MTELSKLTQVDLREVWKSEAQDFTPWLAHEHNLSFLSDTLGIDLELEAVEQSVGPFRADILCKDTRSNRWVIIENQLERTDHTHLGQLITYAAGLSAVTIVWIAARFADEHRAAIDWLNKITEQDVLFFALEVELWKIDDGAAAPKFNIASSPNNWSRSASGAKRAIEDGILTEARQMLLDYWTAFELLLPRFSTSIRPVKPLVQNWMVHSLGRSGVTLNASWNRQKNWIRVEIYLTGKKAVSNFEQLTFAKADIEAEMEEELIWYDIAAKDRRIYLTKKYQDVTDRSTWEEQHTWLAENMDRLHQVFSRRVSVLNVDSEAEINE